MSRKLLQFDQLPRMSELERSSKDNLKEVLKTLPSNLHFDKEAREKILAEDATSRKKEKERHEMAPYRIEIQFGSTRSTVKETVAKIRVWESAKKLTGSGDVSMHFCDKADCLVPFSAENFSDDVVVCPHCYRSCFREDTTTALGPVKALMSDIRALVCQLWYVLGGQADIVSLWIRKDVRLLKEAKHFDSFRELEMKDWERVVYPYWRIVDDTMFGQSLDRRLKEFLG